ncbi:BrnA antitoxin family protein [Bradyrhizobium erythrophlei]|nr:BrnA antitoxin family protein [Bradyrhizobium erythrophlei]
MDWSTAERASPFKPEALDQVDFNLSIKIPANNRDVPYQSLIKM